MRQGDSLDHFFLGPKSELRQFLKEAIELVVDDYLFWRRNYYPKDPPAIAYRQLQSEDAAAYRGRFHQELFALISDLKIDVPFFSPRYMAHMVSEVAVPGLVAYLATMLYNPNNVSLEASPVTVRFELEVGKQFAALFGYDPAESFGHLCSGGTIANFESLWFNRAGRFLPLAIALACHHEGIEAPAGMPTTPWRLLNVPTRKAERFHVEFQDRCRHDGRDAQDLLRRWSLDAYGDADYRDVVRDRFGETYASPVVLVPRTAHYSWKRAAALLGFGRRNLLPVAVDDRFHMDPDDFRACLRRCREQRRPVIQSVVVLGTTEFGSVDPLLALLAMRDKERVAGLESPVHVDAAYGGYFATIFAAGHRRPSADPRPEGIEHAWLEPLRTACSALPGTESVTVDPHKMGYAPYGAGAVVIRHGFLRRLVAEGAPYALDTRGMGHEDLGKFILEGSKPGAAAAAVLFNHRMMPLDRDGYGRQLLDLCRLAQAFYSKITDQDATWRQGHRGFRIVPFARPETNIVCLLVAPDHARSLAEVGRLNERIAQRFGVRDVESVQRYDYLVSKTRIASDAPFVTGHPWLSSLDCDCEELACLRLVFMNRWAEGETADGIGYLDDFLETLYREAEAFLASEPRPHPPHPRATPSGGARATGLGHPL